MRFKSSSKAPALGAMVALALIGAGCASNAPSSTLASEDVSGSSSTIGDPPAPVGRYASVDTSGTALEIAEQLSDCSAQPGEDRTPGQIDLGATTNWLTLVEIDPLANEPRTAPIKVKTIEMSDGSEGPMVLRLHPNTVEVASWALSQDGAQVFMPTLKSPPDDYALLMLLVSLPGKDLFAASGCGNLVNEDFRKWFGEDSAAIVNSLPGKVGDELQISLRIYEPELPPGPVLLNPGDVSVDYLTSLNGVVVALSADADFGEIPICPRATAGWNDCLYPSDDFDRGGTSMGVWVDDDGILEFWEVDSDIDLSNPIRMLLRVEIPLVEFAGDIPAIRVHLTKEGGVLLALERESEVDGSSDVWAPIWPTRG